MDDATRRLLAQILAWVGVLLILYFVIRKAVEHGVHGGIRKPKQPTRPQLPKGYIPRKPLEMPEDFGKDPFKP